MIERKWRIRTRGGEWEIIGKGKEDERGGERRRKEREEKTDYYSFCLGGREKRRITRNAQKQRCRDGRKKVEREGEMKGRQA